MTALSDGVFTDIEGSTRRWEADTDAMPAAVPVKHDDVLRTAIEKHEGVLFSQSRPGVVLGALRDPAGRPDDDAARLRWFADAVGERRRTRQRRAAQVERLEGRIAQANQDS